MYKQFMIEDSWARNMFKRSNNDYSMADISSDRVNMYV